MGEPMLWSDAENAIGRNRNDDFILSPEAHSEILPPQAGPLKRVLTTPEVKGIIESYGNEDREAVDAQRLYRRVRWIVDRLAILAAATGLVACSWHLFMSYVPDPQPTLVIVHAFLLLGLVGSASWLNWTDPRTKWLKARSKAEQHRVALFNRVLAANETRQDGELALLPLQLAYFRRYQLDVQLSYFKNSGRRLERTVGLPAWITVPSVIVAAGALLVATAYLLNLADERGLVISNVVLKEVRMERAEQLAYWIFVALSLSTVYAIAMTRPAVSEEGRPKRAIRTPWPPSLVLSTVRCSPSRATGCHSRAISRAGITSWHGPQRLGSHRSSGIIPPHPPPASGSRDCLCDQGRGRLP